MDTVQVVQVIHVYTKYDTLRRSRGRMYTYLPGTNTTWRTRRESLNMQINLRRGCAEDG